MNDRVVSWLAWALFILAIIGAIAASFFVLRNRPADDNIFRMAVDITSFIAFAVFALTGALIVSQLPHNAIGWLLMLEAMLVYYWPLDNYVNNLSTAPVDPSPFFLLALWLANWVWLLLIFPVLFIALLFPTGRPPSARWRWIIVAGLGICAFFLFFVSFSSNLGPVEESWRVKNPIGFLPEEAFPFPLFAIALLSVASLCIASLFVRYRRADSVERHQIKWLLYAGSFFVIIYVATFLFGDSKSLISDILDTLLFVAILAMPAAIAIAILRYRLYDIDVIIRKTLVYTVVTAVLALVYFGGVVLLQSLFQTATGNNSPLAIILSTLGIAALFNPVRKRIQELIDRRFYRRKYDAEKTLQAFSADLRNEVDLDDLEAQIVQVIEETIQPELVSLWLISKTNPAPVVDQSSPVGVDDPLNSAIN